MRRMGTRGTRTTGRGRQLLLGVGVLMLVAACGADDRAMQPPDDEQTTTSRVEVTDANAAATATSSAFTLRSDQFAQTGLIPDRFTCRGANSRPPLRWSNLPDDTVELAVVVRDLDAGGFVHWVVAGIDPAVGELLEGQLPVSAIEASNSAGSHGWTGPCPPAGTHRYEFKVYALAFASNLRPGMPAAEAAALVEGTSARGVASLTGTVNAQ
jgi:Raf kinase inhibitor-like YbhB/YbcL family protein